MKTKRADAAGGKDLFQALHDVIWISKRAKFRA